MIKEKFFAELNKPQLEATLNDINSCTKIVAGAGCGKTKVIASRYLKLVLDMQENKIEDPLSKILVITFTDKAAGEMKERIEKILNKAEIDVFGKKIWVSTFHKWTLEILKKHSIEVGLNPNFELVDEVREKEIYSEIEEKFKNLKTSEIENFGSICADLKISPNILEGKKFKNLLKIMPIQEIFDEIYRIIKQIKSKGLTPCEFLQTTVSSTQKFSKHLEQLNRYQYTKEDYIAHWARVLENYSDENCDFESAFEEIAGKKIIIDKNGQRKPENWLIKEDYLQKILEIEEIEIIFAKTIALIYAIFQAELSKRSLADFDDLINKTLEIFKTKPNILKKYKNQFKHIIIDEFQDTNGAQLELIKLILADNEANITFVGDRKQSIYGFRYAQMENLEVLHDVIQKKYNKNYPEISLNINYRSTPKILEKVNVLVEKYLKLNEKLNSGGEFKEEFSVIKKTIENPTSSSDIELRQAEYMVSEILDLKEKHNYKFSDFAILVSSHTEADFIEETLAKNNIAANKKVNKSFFKS
ncbi:ATP-dependent helicase, partial [bacterium]|nr:ATP-dependent helicase [bacterium]